jgi:hypothetical protein
MTGPRIWMKLLRRLSVVEIATAKPKPLARHCFGASCLVRCATPSEHDVKSDLPASTPQIIFALLAIALITLIPTRFVFDAMYHGWWDDDARRYVAWMVRWNDPQLFEADYLTNFYEAQSPVGYRTLFWLANAAGIEPKLFHYAVPLLVIVIAACATWRLSLTVTRSPFVAVIATAIVCNGVVSGDHAHGTPRAAAWIVFPLFLLSIVTRHSILGMFIILLAASFYPVAIPSLAGALLILVLADRISARSWRAWFLHTWPLQANIALSAACIFPYLLLSKVHGENFTISEAKLVPSLQAGGRNAFFPGEGSSAYDFWICNFRSGFMPTNWCSDTPYGAALLLLILAAMAHGVAAMFRASADAAERLALSILALVFSAMAMWVLSHAMLFRGYLPNRQTEFVLQIAAGPAFVVVLHLIAEHWPRVRQELAGQRYSLGSLIKAFAALLIACALVLYARPYGYVGTQHPGLHQFLQGQRPQPNVASLAEEADNIPAFGKSRVLVSNEFLYAYNKPFYQAFRERVRALVEALVATERAPLQRLRSIYDVTHFLVQEQWPAERDLGISRT